MTTLSIGQVAQRTGLRASALRYYEDAGLLPPPARVGGRRVYDDRVIRRIDGFRFAQAAGFTLKEIKVLFQDSGTKSTLSTRWQSMARKKLLELDQLAARVVRMREALELGLKCGCVRIEDCLLIPKGVSATKIKKNGGCA